MRRPSTCFLAIVLIIALALALRLAQLDFQPLWWDEGYSVFFATRSLPNMLERTAVDIHPPLYYALLQSWISALGVSLASLRLYSVLVGVLLVPVGYAVARRLFSPCTAGFAALLLATSPLLIYYSQEVRMYGLVTPLLLVSILLQLKLLDSQRLASESPAAQGRTAPDRTRTRLLWSAYIVVCTAALYTQYFAAFMLVAHVLVIAYLNYRRSWQLSWRPWLLAWLAITLLYLPWLIFAGGKLYAYVTAKVGIEQYARLDPISYLSQHLTAYSIGHLSKLDWLSWGTLAFLAVALAGYLLQVREYPHLRWNAVPSPRDSSELHPSGLTDVGYVFCSLYLFTPLILGWLLNLVYSFHPIRYERLLLFAAPIFLILVARGLDVLWTRQRLLGAAVTGAVMLLCALSLFDFYTTPRYPDEDYRELTRQLERGARQGDLVLAFYPWQIGYLETYYRGAPLVIHEVPSEEWLTQPDALGRELTLLRASYPRVWLLAYQKLGRQLEDRLTNEFINDYVLADEWHGNTRLEGFVRASDLPATTEPLTLAPALDLVEYAAAKVSTPVGERMFLVKLVFQADSDEFAYSLRVGNNSQTIAQQDALVPPGRNIVRRALDLPPAAPPGEYELQVVVYRHADSSPLVFPDGSNILALGKLRVP